jgi:hypothetical protein
MNVIEEIVIVFAFAPVLGCYRQKAPDSVKIDRASRVRISCPGGCSFASHNSKQGGVE